MIGVTVVMDGRPYYFKVDGCISDGEPFITKVFTDTGYDDDMEIEYVMLDWKEQMMEVIRGAANERA